MQNLDIYRNVEPEETRALKFYNTEWFNSYKNLILKCRVEVMARKRAGPLDSKETCVDGFGGWGLWEGGHCLRCSNRQDVVR